MGQYGDSDAEAAVSRDTNSSFIEVALACSGRPGKPAGSRRFHIAAQRRERHARRMSSKGSISTPRITHVGQNDLIRPTEHSPLEQLPCASRDALFGRVWVAEETLGFVICSCIDP